MAGPGCPLMHAIAAAMKDNLARLQLSPAPDRRRIETCRETHEDQIRLQRDISDARQIFLAAQQMQLVQLHSGQNGPKLAAPRNEKLDPGFSNARLVVAGLGERICATFWHLVAPIKRSPEERRNAPAHERSD